MKDDISEESMNGVFMCGYPVFKEIYQLEVRKSARSTIPESLVLVTVVPMYSSQPDKNHSQMKDSMHTLERALRSACVWVMWQQSTVIHSTLCFVEVLMRYSLRCHEAYYR